MISCPAAKQIRWVNPSIATVSPSRTRSATASRIDVTLLGALPTGRASDRARDGVGASRYLGAGLLEDPGARPRLVIPQGQGRGYPHGRVPGSQHEQSSSETGH